MKDEMVCLEPFDWRYSAAIVGLRKYLEWLGVEESDLTITEESLEYNKKYFTRRDFLKFAEFYFKNEMHHIAIEEILEEENPSETQIAYVNEKMKANKILKDLFKKIKFDGQNQAEIKKIINENREEIIYKTFQNKSNLYKNYCNPNQLFKDRQECCRLNGYYVDMPKKGKSISYAFDKLNYVGNDIPEFDFIPFAFSGGREKFFINDNFNLNYLQKTNDRWAYNVKLQKADSKMNTKKIFVDCIIRSYDLLKSDIEIIVKNPEHEYFETLYLRKESLRILKNMKPYYKVFGFDKECQLDILNEVFNSVINFTLLDDTINELLKKSKDGKKSYVISKLLKINIEIKKEAESMEEMKKSMKIAYACAKKIVHKRDGNKLRISETKLKSYCTKLTNAIILDDYDQFQKILINLSNYAEVPLGFAYDLFEDFEKNKEIAYTFINGLNRYENNNQEGKDYE